MIEFEHFQKVPYNWEPIENMLGYTIPESYKEFYERIGSIGIDDYIYIVNPTECELVEDLISFKNYTKDAYSQLEQYLDEDNKIEFYNGKTGWEPIGYTTNGDFIFFDSENIMVTDSGFELREIYNCNLIKFIELYLKDELDYFVTSDGLIGEVHEIHILFKESNNI